MDRWFRILVSYCLVFLLLNQIGIEKGQDMSIAEKLAKGEKLDAQETQKLEQMFKQMDIVSSWVGSDGNPSVRSIRADQGLFTTPPIGASTFVFFDLVNDQVIPGSTQTKIVLDTIQEYDSNSVVIPYGTAGDSFQINPIYENQDVKSILFTAQTGDYGGIYDATMSFGIRFYKKSDNTPLVTIGGIAGTLKTEGISFAIPVSIAMIETIANEAEAGIDMSEMYFSLTLYSTVARSLYNASLGCVLLR